jgi:hypothetical protein
MPSPVTSKEVREDMPMSTIRAMLLLSMLSAVGSAPAQAPTGTIAGVVTDPAGAGVAEARVIVTNATSGLTRNITTSAGGDYSAAALPSGAYRVTVEAAGFTALECTATVEAGTTTTVNLTLQVGALSEKIDVNDVTPLIHHYHHQVGGVVGRAQIESLPLNGRVFLSSPSLSRVTPRPCAPVTTGLSRLCWPRQ